MLHSHGLWQVSLSLGFYFLSQSVGLAYGQKIPSGDLRSPAQAASSIAGGSGGGTQIAFVDADTSRGTSHRFKQVYSG